MRKEKKKRILTIILAIVAVISVIGASYAVWTYTFEGQAVNLLETEMIEVDLLESNTDVINLTNALPKSDTQGIEQSETFEFAVTTRTKAVTDIFYDLKIEKINVDTGYTSLEDDDIRIYLTDYNNNALIAPIKISDLYNNTFYRTYNKHNKDTNEITTKFKLKAWIDEDVLVNDWNENTRLQYKFKIGVTEKQETSASNAVYSWSTSTINQGATLESISGYTTDYTTLGQNYFLKHNIGSDNTVESNEVCYILNGTMYCLIGGDEGASYETNKETLFASFGEDNCYVYSNDVSCSASGLNARAIGSGYVYANDGFEGCYVNDSGYARCDEGGSVS